jgi:methylated-DNA-[protein]-cysteine S-methyltransferase
MMQHQLFEHGQGIFALVAADDVLIGVIWRTDRSSATQEVEKHYPASIESPSALLHDAWSQIDAYLAGTLTRFTIPFSIEGTTPFQKRVLQALCRCPYASTITYGELARQAGSPKAARAAGAAMAANPLPLVIPCHRVVGTGRKLTGFSGGRGIASKQFLLELEKGK